MFFETITHEQECWAQVLSPEFEAALRKLGDWVDVSGDTPLPLFSLAAAEGMKWYEQADMPCAGASNVRKDGKSLDEAG